MIIGFDTETTGLPDFKARSTDPTQPHLVQLALVICDDNGNESSTQSVLIKPNGWSISAEVTAIHGISHERAMAEGIDEDRAVALFVLMQGRASLRVAHNEMFDRRIMRIAMARTGYERDFIEAIEGRASYCTCNSAKAIVNLPPTEAMLAKGMSGPKPPKLTECIRHFFDEDLAGAHDALVDARACMRIYAHLQATKVAA